MFPDFKVVHYLAIVKMLGDYTLVLCLGLNCHSENGAIVHFFFSGLGYFATLE